MDITLTDFVSQRLADDTSIDILLADKMRVKDFIIKKTGRQDLFTHHLFSSCDKNEIMHMIINTPAPFVIKANNAWRRMKIIDDLYRMDASGINELDKLISFWLNDIGESWESYYKKIQPAIIIEKKLPDMHTMIKAFVIHGKTRYFWFQSYDISSGKVSCFSSSLYTRNFIKLDAAWNDRPQGDYIKPDKFKEIIEIAEAIKADDIFYRVDLYYFYDTEEMLFSEITRHHSGWKSGFPDEIEKQIGGEICI